MLFRYGTTADGTVKKKAHIYTRTEHGIDPRRVDADALWVIRRLRGAGFQAYVVGGAVRDLLASRAPNDFDIATNAHPQQIKRLFRSARVIGRRFRIVHVYFGREKYIEVTTFRSRSAVGVAEHAAAREENNLFGTMEEDAERRDFPINALYYCPIDEQVIDYVGGYPDLRQRRLRTLTPAELSFAEDPVRIIRALKYSSLMSFPIPLAMAGLVRRMRESILACSRERVTEEVYKILTSRAAGQILELSYKLRVFEIIFPALARSLRESRKKFADHPFGQRLQELDRRAAEGKLLDRNAMFAFLFRDLVMDRKDLLEGPEPDFLIQQFLRGIAEPLFPSKRDMAAAAESILREAHPHHRLRAAGQPAIGRPVRAEALNGEARPGVRRRRKRGGRRRRRGSPAARGPTEQG